MKSGRHASRRRKAVVFCFILLIISSLLYGRFSGGWAGDMYVRLARPFWSLAGYGYGTWRSAIDFFVTREQLVSQIAELSKENRLLHERALTRPSFAPQNLGGLTAHVIGKGSHIFGQELVLDKGEKDGIGKGDTVIASDRSLVGRVHHVFPHHAYVMLLGNRGFRAGTKVIDMKDAGDAEVLRAEGLVRGEGFGRVMLDMVSSNALLNEGDTLLTSGFDGIFPPNLLIGKVGRIVSTPSDFFQRAPVLPAADIGTLEVVIVLKTPKVF